MHNFNYFDFQLKNKLNVFTLNEFFYINSTKRFSQCFFWEIRRHRVQLDKFNTDKTSRHFLYVELILILFFLSLLPHNYFWFYLYSYIYIYVSFVFFKTIKSFHMTSCTKRKQASARKNILLSTFQVNYFCIIFEWPFISQLGFVSNKYLLIC